MSRILRTLLLLVALLPFPLAARAAAQSDDRARTKVDPAVLEAVEKQGFAEFWVVLDQQADLNSAASINDWNKRGEYVVKKLQATAERSQAKLRRKLTANKVPFTSFWIANAIYVERGDKQLLLDTAGRHDVVEIVAQEIRPLPPVTLSQQPEHYVAGTIEWGVNTIKAPNVWSSYNVRGEGIVVANIDGGVQFDHPALARQYRGRLANGTTDHNYNWFDPSLICGNPSVVPCDNEGHGTHTMGTMVGDDGGANQIGVAPAARWIAAKGCESLGCTTTALLAAGQWMLAPTDLNGRNARADLRPHIINNSWGDSAGRNTFFNNVVNAWIASGIFPVFSNGNYGPWCQTTGSPADYSGAYAVGAFNEFDQIASFSSRGSSRLDSGMKPNITAPGTTIRSAMPGNEYLWFDGTSMAAPHVAGSIALLWSASSSLIGNISGTRALLDQTAIDVNDTNCGGTAANNNVWGQGKLDVYAAVSRASRDHKATLSGTLTDQATGAAIHGMTVTAVGPAPKQTNVMATSNASGAYTLRLPAGTWKLTVSGYGYASQTITNVAVTSGSTATRNVALASLPRYTISGTVRNTFGSPLPGVVVALNAPSPAATTDANGNYTINGVPQGTYVLHTKPGNRCNEPRNHSVTVNGATTAQLTLPQHLDLGGYTCQATTFSFVPGTSKLTLPNDGTAKPVNLPFSFRFYGRNYTTAYIAPNGFLSFATTMGSGFNWTLPDTFEPHAAIYPFWDELTIDGSAGVYTGVTGTAPNRQFVVEWRNVAMWGDPTQRLTFEALLHENGAITFQYKDIGTSAWERGSSATVGIENADSTIAYPYAYSETVVSNNQAIRFRQQLTNMLRNPGFELDNDFDGSIDDWTRNENFWHETEYVHGGTFSGKHTSSLNMSASYTVSQTVNGIVAGQQYTFIGWVNIPLTNPADTFSFNLKLQWLNASNAVISTQPLKSYTTASYGWEEAAATGLTAPTGATKATFSMEVGNLDGEIIVDDFAFGK